MKFCDLTRVIELHLLALRPVVDRLAAASEQSPNPLPREACDPFDHSEVHRDIFLVVGDRHHIRTRGGTAL
ncbi:hypothetical protein D3C71_2202480 [compost metagenome]